MSFVPLTGEPDAVLRGVDVPAGESKGEGVEVWLVLRSMVSDEEWRADEVVVVVELVERMRVVLVPWTVVPLRLESLVFVLCCFRGDCDGENSIPRADASLVSFLRRSTIAFRIMNSP